MNRTEAHDQNHEARLTAYLLGELDQTETQRVEQALAEDPKLRAEADALRSTINDLTAALAEEPAPALSDAQRAVITTGDAASPSAAMTDPDTDPDIGPDTGPIIFTFRRIAVGAGLAAAACLAVVVSIPFLTNGNPEVAIGEAASDPPVERPAVRVWIDGNSAGRAGGADSVVMGEMEESRASGRRGASRSRLPQASADEARMQRREPAASAAPAGPRPAPSPGAPRFATGQMPPPPPRAAPTEAPEALLDGRVDREIVDDGVSLMERLRQTAPANGGEQYGQLIDNPFVPFDPRNTDSALATFSIDVDTASYSNVRDLLKRGYRPNPDAVRIEEMINYFDYPSYEPASGEHPFSVNTEIAVCPWNPEHRLVRVGLRGRDIDRGMRPATNLVFLVDVSGSMNAPNKLPLVQESLRELVRNLTADDRVAIVVYAGAAGVVLPSTYCDDRPTIMEAIGSIRAGGSTNGSGGIELAYQVAAENFIRGGVNRVILCTDGDFNVGVSDRGALIRLIEEKRRSGVSLTALGFGRGNLNDETMEQLSNHGNGTAAYIDSIDEARKVLVEGMSGTLVTIAKDVKIQVEFNPRFVGAHRLIGYANRILDHDDFNDDSKDAGEIGAGHRVTALFEIAPPDAARAQRDDRNLKFQREVEAAPQLRDSPNVMHVSIRYKEPDGEESILIEQGVADSNKTMMLASPDFKMASAVAAFGMVLRDSEYRGTADLGSIADIVGSVLEADVSAAERRRRQEFMSLIDAAQGLPPRR